MSQLRLPMADPVSLKKYATHLDDLDFDKETLKFIDSLLVKISQCRIHYAKERAKCICEEVTGFMKHVLRIEDPNYHLTFESQYINADDADWSKNVVSLQQMFELISY